jgi:hypothetical protein
VACGTLRTSAERTLGPKAPQFVHRPRDERPPSSYRPTAISTSCRPQTSIGVSRMNRAGKKYTAKFARSRFESSGCCPLLTKYTVYTGTMACHRVYCQALGVNAWFERSQMYQCVLAMCTAGKRFDAPMFLNFCHSDFVVTPVFAQQDTCSQPGTGGIALACSSSSIYYRFQEQPPKNC